MRSNCAVTCTEICLLLESPRILPAGDKSHPMPLTCHHRPISTTPSPSLCPFKMRGFPSEQRHHVPQNHGIRTGHVVGARYELSKMAVGGFGCRDLFHSMTARNEPHDEAICFARRWQGTLRRSSMTCSLFIFPGKPVRAKSFVC